MPSRRDRTPAAGSTPGCRRSGRPRGRPDPRPAASPNRRSRRCLAMNCVTPAPEPVGLYDRFLPGHAWPHTWLNTAIAFCWAVEPSAVSAFLPPQSARRPHGRAGARRRGAGRGGVVVATAAGQRQAGDRRRRDRREESPAKRRAIHLSCFLVSVFVLLSQEAVHPQGMWRWWTESSLQMNRG